MTINGQKQTAEDILRIAGVPTERKAKVFRDTATGIGETQGMTIEQYEKANPIARELRGLIWESERPISIIEVRSALNGVINTSNISDERIQAFIQEARAIETARIIELREQLEEI